ncbi:MAG: hypothetical protein KZQ66_10035 [Candidatus Thiodiazotropha sp. (ex Lucinoma aequizonata)]|nr:hypothetical protein [Candidatus Thiodiazotropha sp. (ex Lucinoma aequizonata)]MCU7887828.1 hypothetical protein [Candidatus Thiodiazotropha sp. (ex Lucinoma aequizonata)]MCU7896953.1 hypothetical protein [Candidatus Thiodiazotropha sp. (ex Lucinoma aequizonata)]MCU7898656.1 hypothetical protein [Candidatus Thiodiazotropha sp. (ex Lucinoma aequizonata)]MCU7902284.1 hypothetical protein [Candidatus Thiodiazotropha sp. (ex Lucinoma aequizonata)]
MKDFGGLGCPKIFREIEDTLVFYNNSLLDNLFPGNGDESIVPLIDFFQPNKCFHYLV